MKDAGFTIFGLPVKILTCKEAKAAGLPSGPIRFGSYADMDIKARPDPKRSGKLSISLTWKKKKARKG